MRTIDENTFQRLEDAPDPSRLLWETTSRQPSFQTPIFGLNKVHRRSKDGREGDFVELDSRDGVNVVPYFIGSDGIARFVMERQFRHGTEETTLEFPAGLVEKGEDPAVAAARELLEETGLSSASLVKIGSISQNAAYMNNTIHFFLAEDLKLEVDLADRRLDDFEEIDVVCASAQEIIDRLGSKELDNAVAVLGGFFFQKEMKRRGLSF